VVTTDPMPHTYPYRRSSTLPRRTYTVHTVRWTGADSAWQSTDAVRVDMTVTAPDSVQADLTARRFLTTHLQSGYRFTVTGTDRV